MSLECIIMETGPKSAKTPLSILLSMLKMLFDQERQSQVKLWFFLGTLTVS